MVNHPKVSKWVRGIAFWASYLLLLFFLGGLLAHRSYRPVWFGRYSTAYAFALVGLFLLVLFWKPIFDSLCRETRVQWSGKTLVFSTSRKFTVVMLPLFLFVGAVEVKLRRASPWIREVNPDLVAQFHPFLQNDLVPNDPRLRVNAHGFRGEAIPPKEECDVLVFILGGSTVLSHDVPYEDSHPVLLQQQLRSSHPNIRILVQNAGNEYHVVLHSLIKYATRIRPLRPDIVIMWHGINDLSRSFYPNRFTMPNTPYRDDYRHFLGPIAGIIEYYAKPVRRSPFIYSAFAEWLADSLYSDLRSAWAQRKTTTSLHETTVEEFPSLAAFEQHLDALLTLLRNDGVEVIVASEPTMYGAMSPSNLWMQKSLCRSGDAYPSLESLWRGMELFNEKSRQLAQRHQAWFLDLDALLPKDPRYMFDDCHYTKEGNSEVARLIAGFIVEQGVIERVLKKKSSGLAGGSGKDAMADRSGDLGQSTQDAGDLSPEEVHAGAGRQVGAP